MPETFNLEEYFNEFADAGAMAEASRFRTLPTGSYPIQIKKHEGTKFNGSDRLIVHFTADALNENGKKAATVFFNATWIPEKNDKGELDRVFKLWEQLTRALFPELKAEERSKKSVGEVINAAMSYPVKAYITESYHVPAIDGSKKWTTPRTAEEVVQYKTAGYEARNYVQNIGRV